MAGRLNAAPAAGSGAPTGGRLQKGWQPPSTGYVPSLAEEQVKKSFSTLDAPGRARTLESLATKANAGDAAAHRKLLILQPVASDNLPSTAPIKPAPTFRNPVLNAVSDFATETIGKPIQRGEQALHRTEINNATGRPMLEGVNKKQFVADAVNTGLNAVGGGITRDLIKGAPTLSKIIHGAAEGAALGGTGAGASSFGAGDDPLHVGANAVLGAAAGAGLGGAIPGAADGAKNVIPAAGRLLRSEAARVKSAIPTVNAAEPGIKIASMSTTRNRIQDAKGAAAKITEGWLDRGAPLKNLVGQVQQELGRNLKGNENPYELAKLIPGYEGQVTTHLQDTAGWMQKVPADIRSDGDKWGYAKQFLSQADKRSPQQLKDAQYEVDRLKAKYGDGIGALDEYAAKTRETFDTLLEKYRNPGEGFKPMISKERYDELKANPDYFGKMEVLHDETAKLFGGGSMSSRELSGMKNIKGQGKDAQLAPSAEAYVAQTIRTMQDVAKYKVASSLGKAADEIKATTGENGAIFKIRNTDDVKLRNSMYELLHSTKPLKQFVDRSIRKEKTAVRNLGNELKRRGIYEQFANRDVATAERVAGKEVAKAEDATSKLNQKAVDASTTPRAAAGDKPILSGTKDVLAGATRMNSPLHDAPKLSGTVVTQQFSRSLTPKETRELVNRLITDSPEEITKLKQQILGSEKATERAAARGEKAVAGKTAVADRRAALSDAKRQELIDTIDRIAGLRGEAHDIGSTRSAAYQAAMGATDAHLPKGYTRISYIEDGIRNEVAVPEEVGNYLTGANKATVDQVTGIMAKVNNIFRQAVTTWNPVFALFRNPVRDFRDFLVNSKYVPVHRALDQWASAVVDGLFSGKGTAEFLRAGGGQAGYLANEGGRRSQSVAKQARQLVNGRSITRRVVTSPRDLLEHVGTALENAPRLAEFRGAKAAGLSNEEAANAGRTATIDFAQGGNAAKTFNLWVPFLNARIQGSRKAAQSFTQNPKRAILAYGATAAAPMAALMTWNLTQHKDVWDSISDYEKQNNFIFIYGSGNNGDKATQVIKIPKGYIDQVVGNTLETVMELVATKGDGGLDKLAKAALSAASNFSPVSFEKDGKFSADQIISGVTPPVAKVPIEISANKDFFTGGKIVPDKLKDELPQDQVKPTTSGAAKFIGGILNKSPLQVDHVIKGFTGNVVQDVTGGGKSVAGRFMSGVTQADAGVGTAEFYKAYNPAYSERVRVSNKVTALAKDGNVNQAKRVAEDYNASLVNKFDTYVKEYKGKPGYDPKNEDKIKALEISVTPGALKSRATTAKKKKTTNSTSFLSD